MDFKPGNSYEVLMRYPFQPESMASYRFTVSPYWWQTTAFKISAAILAILIATGSIILRSRAKERKQEDQKQKALLRLQAIRSQLNPHFIFNSLASIQGLVNEQNTVAANTYIAEFSTLMRSALETAGDKPVPLKNEISLLQSYLALEQLRFGFQFRIEVDKSINAETTDIPPILLQPAVENAVRHGVAGLRREGVIELKFRIAKQDMIAEIRDNGPGPIDTEGKGFGLTLTRERIALLNRLDPARVISMDIQNATPGTLVRFIFKNRL